ncbi:hypothetical protein [Pseudoalteromonas sp. McH1-42]|uniref:hypothetical protein n=1 Tax=Pseudoalteromonas sp. McH1-42 TaxID=2917752 RepID=UPI001EF5C64C|nr:hypothetical protein [Pseudoalteromonas sp. McH1-42]MCG7564566.1 hypothetical protein [Pseudoalteromonas sp. McH1-42]
MTYQFQDYQLQQLGIARSLGIVEENDAFIGAELKKVTDKALHSFDTNDSWTYSFLNRTGAPLEYSFNTMSNDLRYTLEVGKPQLNPTSKLSLIEDLMDQLVFNWPKSEVESYMEQLQQGQSLEWGAWLGVRHGKGKTEFKKYAEIPSQGKVDYFLLKKYLPEFLRVEQGLATPVMLGNKLGSERCEIYFDLNHRSVTVSDLHQLLAYVGLEHRTEVLMELVKSFLFREESEDEEYLPEAQWGFSYSVLPGSKHAAFSLYAMTTGLYGGDGFVRQQFLTNSMTQGWDAKLYAELSTPISRWGLRAGYHNMISFVISEQDSGYHLSLSPPPSQP